VLLFPSQATTICDNGHVSISSKGTNSYLMTKGKFLYSAASSPDYCSTKRFTLYSLTLFSQSDVPSHFVISFLESIPLHSN